MNEPTYESCRDDPAVREAIDDEACRFRREAIAQYIVGPFEGSCRQLRNLFKAKRGFINVWASAALSTIFPGTDVHAGSLDASATIKPYYDFLCHMSVGDVELALAQFADDAVVVTGGPCTVEHPCRGKLAIKEHYIAPILQNRRSLPLASRYDRLRMHTIGVHRADDRQIFEFQEGKIVRVQSEGMSEGAPTLTAGRD